jgi:plasmid stabilization system protein ParE
MQSEERSLKRNLIIAPAARDDLKEIWNYIAQDSLDAADRVAERLQDAVLRLGQFPGSGHMRRDLADQRPMLFVAEGSYLILYRVTQHSVEIAAVLHGSRDILAVLREREPEE